MTSIAAASHVIGNLQWYTSDAPDMLHPSPTNRIELDQRITPDNASTIRSFTWGYPGPFSLSFYEQDSETPYAVVYGPKDTSFTSGVNTNFTVAGYSEGMLTVVKANPERDLSFLFPTPDAYLVVRAVASTDAAPPSAKEPKINIVYGSG
ncbi:hypothetical protein HDV03_003304 [Kappamyces sp. JEL0829]|nr:hypothetical protein HDV03_003304 [Kappamyces sp. JEL0829]